LIAGAAIPANAWNFSASVTLMLATKYPFGIFLILQDVG
jgi:hypothetical protein